MELTNNLISADTAFDGVEQGREVNFLSEHAVQTKDDSLHSNSCFIFGTALTRWSMESGFACANNIYSGIRNRGFNTAFDKTW